MPNDYDVRNLKFRQPQPTLDQLQREAIGSKPEPQVVEKVVEVVPENAIVRRDDGAMVYKRFVMTATGLEIPDDCSISEWRELGYVIKGFDTSISWVIGDWARLAMDAGTPASQIAEEFGYETNTIEVYVSICRAIHALIRNQALTFGHHRLVARLSDDQKLIWLSEAEEHRWTVGQMAKAMQPKITLPENWRTWRKSGGRLEKALKGKINLSRDEFEDELQQFVNQARVLWARRNGGE